MHTTASSSTVDRAVSNLAPGRIVGGIGGLAFAAVVILQNLLRASAPAAGAAPGDVISYYASHRGITAVLAVTFAISGVALAAFAGAMYDRLAHGRVRAAAFAGLVGIAGIVASFSLVVATDVALSVYVGTGGASLDTTQALWIVHNSVFAVLFLSIGIAVAGLSAAASAEGLLGAIWRPIGAIGGLLLAVGAGAAPAIADGSKVMLVSLAGFLAWLAFVLAASVALLRESKG
jgi:hypothetical protein